MPSSSEREAFWRNLLTRRDTLRLTVGEACEQAGVSPASFYQWQRKLRESERRTTPSSAQATPLAPVRIVNDRVVELTLELPQQRHNSTAVGKSYPGHLPIPPRAITQRHS